MTERTSAAHTSVAHRATWREWTGLAVLSLPVLVLATDLTVLLLAMPSITADLQPGASAMLWILHIYGFTIAGFLITMGRLGDRIGRRRLLLTGAAAFAALVVVAAYSVHPAMLIAARALLGVAGATLMPSAFALLRSMFHDAGQRRFAISVQMAAFMAGAALGPLLGGVLLEFFWWGSVFLINLPALALLLAVGPWLLPEYRDPDAQRLDLPSVGLSLGAMLGVIYALQEAVEHGFAARHLLVLVAAVALGVVFVRRQRRLADPLLDLTLFAHRRFSASLGAVLLSGFSLAGAFLLLTQYLQWVLELTPLQAGLWTLPYVLASLVGALLAPLLVRWVRHAYAMALGMLACVVGAAAAATIGVAAGLPEVVAWFALAGLGQGVAMTLGSDLIISTAPVERAGSAAAMQEVSGELGAALGMALVGSLGALVYRVTMGRVLPEQVPDGVAETAERTIAGAVDAAERLPGPIAEQVLVAAREAFSHALTSALWIAAFSCAVVAVLVVVTLRRVAAPS
ncbi:MFS transporter [Haloechinothrix sp. LS1_15]|uniref:MFS transporter n=1 Tax=Haloechinothrix sp. LS1_15 TaxID=2652248 RepID=UPI002945E6ED|nr:MFS transporter [Haloechinothrix sp. LS1_15]MDV6011317.1 MFS transporter [Haloechinothrix sp. LS1_15]